MLNIKAVRAWLEAKGITCCSACGCEDLQISKDLYALVCVDRTTQGPDYRRGSRAVRLRCTNCAQLVLLHARQMGLE